MVSVTSDLPELGHPSPSHQRQAGHAWRWAAPLLSPFPGKLGVCSELENVWDERGPQIHALM